MSRVPLPLVVSATLSLPAPASATWIVAPGIGVAAAQAGVDRTRANQTLIHEQLLAGTPSAETLDMLRMDPYIERRQFEIVDMRGRSVGFSGAENGAASLSEQGRVDGTDIHFSVQGNILASEAVVHDAARAFSAAGGTLADRVMVAMEAADLAASFNDGSHSLYLSVTDEDILPSENANPVKTLRMRYDAWKADGGVG